MLMRIQWFVFSREYMKLAGGFDTFDQALAFAREITQPGAKYEGKRVFLLQSRYVILETGELASS